MKKRITKILGVVLSLALLSSLAMIAAPVSAADGPGQNKWGPIALPDVWEDGVDVELLAVAADGTIFASVYDFGADTDEWWSIYKSTDGGWTWTITRFADYGEEIRAIVCAPNWGSNDTFYVGTDDGQVFRCTDAGATEPVLLRQIVGNDPDYPEDIMEASIVYDMDLWTDGGSMWIMVATDIDILVMEDALFAEWIDMDLSISFDGTHESQDGTDQDTFDRALVSRFAPDFDQSGLIWTILEDDDGDAWISATISPGQWGQVVNSVEIDLGGWWLRSYQDMAFADYYSSTSAPILYTAMNTAGPNGDDLYLIEGGFEDDNSVATPLEVDGGGIDFMSIEVSGEVIMAGEFQNANVWISRNAGDTFDEAMKPPTGEDWTRIVMAPGAFDPDEGVAYAATSGDNSGFSYTLDGGETWNQTAFVDTDIDNIIDLAFGSPAILITDDWGGPESMWRCDDITAAAPNWERVYDDYNSDLWGFRLVEYSLDGSVLMLFGRDGGDSVLEKSTDNGQTFSHWRTLPGAMGEIQDFVMYDSATVLAACDGGFYGTTRFGPAKQRLTTESLCSIALQPGFDSNDPDNMTLVVGNDDGEIFASADGGSTWGDAEAVGAGCVYVAFDQLDEDQIYYATESSTVGSATIDGDEVGDDGALEDSEETIVDADTLNGIWVAPDNALYAMAADSSTGATTYDYDADGTVYIQGEPQILYNLTVREVGGTVEVNVLSGDPSGIYLDYVVGVFIQDEVLAVVGANLEVAAGPTITGWIQVQGLVSGAVGSATVNNDSLPGTFTPGEYLEIIDSLAQVDMTQDTITISDAALGTGFVDGETLNITGWSLTGNTSGNVDGSITVQGATSFEEDSIAIVDEGSGGFFDTEVVDVVSSTLDVDAVATPGSVTTNEALLRLLLGEPYNNWEMEAKSGAYGIWGFSGSNFVFTTVGNDELWGLEDTLSGKVAGVTVSNIGETKATVSWSAMTGAKEYEVMYDSDSVFTTKLTTTLTGLDDDTDYEVQVRVATDHDFESRWSTAVEFTTLQAIAQPENLVPEQGMQNAPLLPSFVWTEISNAVEYEFQLSTDPAFGTMLVDEILEITAYTLTTELAYDTNHYWRVRAVSDTGTKSTWCFSNFHTRTEAIPPVTVEPPPTPTINLPPPQVTVIPPDVNITLPPPQVTVVPPAITVDVPDVVTVTQQPQPTLVLPEADDPGTPVYIWVIVGIGAILTIAVIVLIIRTRRVV